MRGWNLDHSVILDSEIELVMENSAMFLPSGPIPH